MQVSSPLESLDTVNNSWTLTANGMMRTSRWHDYLMRYKDTLRDVLRALQVAALICFFILDVDLSKSYRLISF